MVTAIACFMFGTGVTLIAMAIDIDSHEDEIIIAQLTERNKEIDNMIASNETVIAVYKGVRETAVSAREDLTSAKNKFADGGHCLDGEPLASDKFKFTDEKIGTAISEMATIISLLEGNITILKNEKKQNEAKIAELSK